MRISRPHNIVQPGVGQLVQQLSFVYTKPVLSVTTIPPSYYDSHSLSSQEANYFPDPF